LDALRTHPVSVLIYPKNKSVSSLAHDVDSLTVLNKKSIKEANSPRIDMYSEGDEN